ncbi:hypothetical protein ACFQO1_10810 [Jejudonia soesokkakensis]|uniref:Uncharacterized protein n=1 Tax=Jejudonia soesokkakensis TaxID=1323432 RepID=A0ABW2MWA6_9FLAO
MKFLKKYKSLLPEVILILSTFFYMFNSGFIINPIAVAIVIAIVAQIYFNNLMTGIVMALLFSMIFGYLFLALYSDIVKFDTLSDAWQMIVFGTAYLGISLAASIGMVFKYIMRDTLKENAAIHSNLSEE